MPTHCGKEESKVNNDIAHCRPAPLPAEHKKGKEKEATIPPALDDKNYSFTCPDTHPNPGLVKVPPKSAWGNCHLTMLAARKKRRHFSPQTYRT